MKCPTCGIIKPPKSNHTFFQKFEHRDPSGEPCEGNGLNSKNEKYKKHASESKKEFIKEVKLHIANGLKDKEISELMGEENISVRMVGMIRHEKMWKDI